MNGYVNPFMSTSQAQMQQLMKRRAKNQNNEKKRKVFTIDFMLTLRNSYKERPANMALLDFPHKRKRNLRQHQMNETDRFNQTVKELRIMLNKLSQDNFDTITKQILNDYNFSPTLLNELMKILFMKATTEGTYLEIYVKLCIQLFKRYNDKENQELNFRKLLLTKCQKQFLQMHNKEEQERKLRR